MITNKKIKINFENFFKKFIIGTLKQEKEYDQVRKAVDVKTLIKMKKQNSILKKPFFLKKNYYF